MIAKTDNASRQENPEGKDGLAFCHPPDKASKGRKATRKFEQKRKKKKN
jgi:hypothetical protein